MVAKFLLVERKIKYRSSKSGAELLEELRRGAGPSILGIATDFIASGMLLAIRSFLAFEPERLQQRQKLTETD